MNPEKKEQFVKGALSIMTLAAAIAFNSNMATGAVFNALKSVFGLLAPNWAAQFSLEALMPSLKKKILSDPNPQINHHINCSLILSWKTTIDQVLLEYTQKKGGLHGKEEKTLPEFINKLKAISDREFLEKLNEDSNHEEIFVYTSSDNAKIGQHLERRFNLSALLDPFSDEYYLTQEFIGFFNERVPALMSFHFRADLKKGKEAKNAMDLLYHETIREAVNQLSKKQDEHLRILNEIKNSVDKAPGLDEFEKLVMIAVAGNLQNEIYAEVVAIRNGYHCGL